MFIAFHVNAAQPHQREHARWLKAGLERHGLKLKITTSVTDPADVHIVSGPWYAKNQWLDHPRTILLDRAYYHGRKSGLWSSMDWVSLGWMRNDGGRRFTPGCGRSSPDVKVCHSKTGSIFLADYNGPIDRADAVRLHPNNRRYPEQLTEVLRGFKTAIGYQTTALVTAALEGLEIVCKDKRNIMAEPNWLELLPYADWKYSEIQSGEAWEHLKNDIYTGNSSQISPG